MTLMKYLLHGILESESEKEAKKNPAIFDEKYNEILDLFGEIKGYLSLDGHTALVDKFSLNVDNLRGLRGPIVTDLDVQEYIREKIDNVLESVSKKREEQWQIRMENRREEARQREQQRKELVQKNNHDLGLDPYIELKKSLIMTKETTQQLNKKAEDVVMELELLNEKTISALVKEQVLYFNNPSDNSIKHLSKWIDKTPHKIRRQVKLLNIGMRAIVEEFSVQCEELKSLPEVTGLKSETIKQEVQKFQTECSELIAKTEISSGVLKKNFWMQRALQDKLQKIVSENDASKMEEVLGDNTEILEKITAAKSVIAAKNIELKNLLMGRKITRSDLKKLENEGAFILAKIDGESLLHIAARSGEVENYQLLNSRGVLDVNAKNSRGQNVLHIAAEIGDVGMCEEIVMSASKALLPQVNVFEKTTQEIAPFPAVIIPAGSTALECVRICLNYYQAQPESEENLQQIQRFQEVEELVAERESKDKKPSGKFVKTESGRIVPKDNSQQNSVGA